MLPVAITGLGLVCAVGSSLREAWPRLLAGEHGIAPIARFDASAYAACLAAEVPALPAMKWQPDRATASSLRRGTRLFLAAAEEAWADANLSTTTAAATGVAAGASVNYLHIAQLRSLWEHRDAGTGRIDPAAASTHGLIPAGTFFRRLGDTMAAAAASALGVEGPRFAVDTACASGSHAIIEAFRLVARGDVPAMVAGGGSGVIMPMTLLAFSRIGALSTSRDRDRASRPFDRGRDGFVIGEGAAAVVLEPLDAARRRGARIYAELAGAATTVNAHSLTDPSPDGRTEAATMALALADAGLQPADIDYVAAHGTSTPKNDATEAQAIHQVFGAHARRLAVSSNKGHLGHTLPAAGAINVVVAAMALAEQMLPPTASLREQDPACDLDCVPGVGRAGLVRAALANAFAFGGQNAVIALRSADTAEGLARVPVPDGEAAA